MTGDDTAERTDSGDTAERTDSDETESRTAGSETESRTAKIETEHDEPAIVAASLFPDNTDSMRTTVRDGRVTTRIERETTGGLQATVDDYVVNLSVAEDVIDRAKSHADASEDAHSTQTQP